MNQFLEEQYKNLGISREVYEFGEKIEESLKGESMDFWVQMEPVNLQL